MNEAATKTIRCIAVGNALVESFFDSKIREADDAHRDAVYAMKDSANKSYSAFGEEAEKRFGLDEGEYSKAFDEIRKSIPSEGKFDIDEMVGAPVSVPSDESMKGLRVVAWSIYAARATECALLKTRKGRRHDAGNDAVEELTKILTQSLMLVGSSLSAAFGFGVPSKPFGDDDKFGKAIEEEMDSIRGK